MTDTPTGTRPRARRRARRPRPASTSSCAAHLAALKLDTAAEHLPAVLDHAAAEGLSLTAALERLLGLEVDATQARRLAGRLRFASPAHPRHPRGVRLRRPTRRRPHADHRTGHLPLPRNRHQRAAHRPARRREDPPRRRARPQSRRSRLPHLLHHRRRPRRPLPPRRHRRTLGLHHALLRRPHPARPSTNSGYLPLPAEAASALFQVVAQRYLKTSIVLTTNRGVGSWGEILGDTTVAAAMLDRLLHRSVVLNLDGDSYRLRDHHARTDTSAAPPPAPANPYPDHRLQVGNFDEHTWGISVSAVTLGR